MGKNQLKCMIFNSYLRHMRASSNSSKSGEVKSMRISVREAAIYLKNLQGHYWNVQILDYISEIR